jgi:hypothetical protein
VIHAIRQSDDRTRAMFRRYLSGWTMDLLELRRRGLDRPCQRQGSGEPAAPFVPGSRPELALREAVLAGAGSFRRPGR